MAGAIKNEMRRVFPGVSAASKSVDRHVAAALRERRVTLGLSQGQLAKAVGVTYQQMHKYELGQNRISAGRLFEIAAVLNVSIAYFFEGLTTISPGRDATPRQRLRLEFARNCAMIDNDVQRDALRQMSDGLAAKAQLTRSQFAKAAAI